MRLVMETSRALATLHDLQRERDELARDFRRAQASANELAQRIREADDALNALGRFLTARGVVSTGEPIQRDPERHPDDNLPERSRACSEMPDGSRARLWARTPSGTVRAVNTRFLCQMVTGRSRLALCAR